MKIADGDSIVYWSPLFPPVQDGWWYPVFAPCFCLAELSTLSFSPLLLSGSCQFVPIAISHLPHSCLEIVGLVGFFFLIYISL